MRFGYKCIYGLVEECLGSEIPIPIQETHTIKKLQSASTTGRWWPVLSLYLCHMANQEKKFWDGGWLNGQALSLGLCGELRGYAERSPWRYEDTGPKGRRPEFPLRMWRWFFMNLTKALNLCSVVARVSLKVSAVGGLQKWPVFPIIVFWSIFATRFAFLSRGRISQEEEGIPLNQD